MCCKIQGVARAIKYLHYFEPVVVHGNIRGVRFLFLHPFSTSPMKISQLNIMIDAEEQPILCDYGLVYMSAESDGAYRWIAPEILDPEKDADPVYTTRSDVYAFAMTMLEVRSPFFFKYPSAEVLNSR